MAKFTNDGSELTPSSDLAGNSQNAQHFDATDAAELTVGDGGLLSGAVLTKQGYDLVLTGEDGQSVIIDNYFLAEPQPDLVSAAGHHLSPQLVKSFLSHDGYGKFAAVDTYTDESAIGLVTETNGQAIITRTDGSQHTLEKGMAVFQGDVIETEYDAAVNIAFIDESSFSIGEDARMAIDEFVFDPATNDGTTNVSILRGVFMYTSGLMGRDNPDSVEIDTPVGSIGIRGTIIGGTIMPADSGESQITVVEGAIVVTNGSGQQILSSQFETVKLAGFESPIQNIGQLDSGQMNQSYGGVRDVSGNLFSSIDDSGQGAANNQNGDEGQPRGDDEGTPAEPGEPQGEQRAGEPQDGAQQDGAPQDKHPQGPQNDPDEQNKENGELKEGQQPEEKGDNQDQNTPKDGEPGDKQSLNQDGDDFGNNDPMKANYKPNLGSQPSAEGDQNYDSNPQTKAPLPPAGGDNIYDGNTTQTWDKAPEIQVIQSYSVDENDSGAQILAKLDIWDPNAGDHIDLSRISVGGYQNGPNAPMQVVLNNGEYFLVKNAGSSFNFENFSSDPTTLDTSQPLGIRIWDDNTQVWKDFSVPLNVHNQNEAPQLNVTYRTDTDTSYNIDENGLGPNVVARLHITDEDKRAEFNDNDPYISDNRFEIVPDADGNPILRVKSGVTFDHETESHVNLQIYIYDDNNNQLKSSIYNLTVDVLDRGDAPTDITLTNTGTAVSSIEENAVAGSLIGLLNTADADSGESFSYSLSGPNAAELTIVNGNELRLLSSPNFETEQHAQFRVTVTDKDGLTHFKDFNININDVNETPIDIQLANPANTSAFAGLDENLAAHTVIATLKTVDPDTGNTFTYNLDGSADAGKFYIDGDKIKLNQALSYEDQHSYSFNVTVDDGVNNYTKLLTLNVNDVPEAPIDITLNNDHIFENYSGTIYQAAAGVAVKGLVLGRVNIDDPEGDHFAQTDFVIEHPVNNISMPMNEYIEIVPVTDGYTLKLKDNVLIHKVSSTAYEFIKGGVASSFQITDDGNGHFPIDFRITVNDTDASDSYSETFKLTIKDNLILLRQLSGTDGYVIENDARNIGVGDPNADFGRSVTVGDFNGDGALDVASGAPGAINGDTESSGGFYVLKGNSTNLRDVNHSGDNHGDQRVLLNQIVTNNNVGYFTELTTAGDDNGKEFADKIVNLGDTNGDGYDDLFVSSPGENKAYIYFGNNGGANSHLTLTNLPNALVNDITLTQVGDINGDGFNDVLFGSPNFSGTNANSGVINIFYGDGKLDTLGTVDYSTNPINVTNFVFEGTTAGDHLGTSLSGIGDFNGDGYDDFIAGASNYNSDTGKAVLFYGGVSTPTPQTAFIGPEAGSLFGAQVTGLGDINGDGLDDIMISAPDRLSTATGTNLNGTGEAYVVFGTQTAIASTTNINSLVSTAANGFTVRYGAGAHGGGDEHLGTTMSSAGDFNGDGYDDFVITGTNGEMLDEAFLVYGGYNLTSYLGARSNTLYLQDILGNGSLGMRLMYNPDMDKDGFSTQDQIVSVSAAGDLNQDGYDDIIMGFEMSKEHMGETYVVYGRDTQSTTTKWTGTTAVFATSGTIYVGNHEDNYLYDNAASGLRADGAGGNDKIKISHTNFDFLDGGAGHDELRLYFSGEETSVASADGIDLRGIGHAIKNIEDFFIDSGTAGGLDALHVNITDVLDWLHQSQDGNIMFSTDQNGGGVNNYVKFYTATGSNQSLTAMGFTNDADSDATQDTVAIGADTYYKYTLSGTDYAVLLDSQLTSSETGGSI